MVKKEIIAVITRTYPILFGMYQRISLAVTGFWGMVLESGIFLVSLLSTFPSNIYDYKASFLICFVFLFPSLHLNWPIICCHFSLFNFGGLSKSGLT